MIDVVRVIRPGLQTTVQDLGRWGWQSRGVAVAGPMDPFSHRAANALVGNLVDAATLEVTVIGPELEFESDRLVAVSGAEFELAVDGEPARTEVALPIARGSRLQFGQKHSGARGYVAVAGGIATAPAFGSRATHIPGRIGGLGGRVLVAGDLVPLGPETARQHLAAASARRLATWRGFRVLAGDRFESAGATASARVRVLAGPQADWFGRDAMDRLSAGAFVITSESNRMGYRLDGVTLDDPGRSLISEATPAGTVQVPPSGQPILLMADRQTTGGYPKIATVISADIGVAGQLGPGDTIQFEPTTWSDAAAALHRIEQELHALEDADER